MLSLFRLWRSSPSFVSAASTRLQHLRELSATESVMDKPKIELHVHLDGAMLPQTIWDVAQRRNIPLPADNVEELEKLLKSSIDGEKTLIDFLNKFPIFTPVVAGDAAAIEQIAYDFCRTCWDNNTIYAEVRICPHLLTGLDLDNLDNHKAPAEGDRCRATVSTEDVVSIVLKGLDRGCEEFGVKVRVILACLQGHPESWEEVLRLADDYRDKGVVGIDIAGDESLTTTAGEFDPALVSIMQRAEELGIHRTCHAGESGPARNVAHAVDILHAERIGHGYKCLDDEELYQRLKDSRIHFEVCPYSSYVTTSVTGDFMDHPICRLVKDGINFSISTDDPILCLSGLKEEYKFVEEKMGLTDRHFAQANLNAAKSCFLPEEEKAELIEIIKLSYAEELKE